MAAGSVNIKFQRYLDTLHIGGITDLGAESAYMIQTMLPGVMTREVRNVEVDLSRVSFIDSSGLGFLMALRNAVGWRGGIVRLVDPHPFPRRILEMTRLHRTVEIVRRAAEESERYVFESQVAAVAEPDPVHL